MISQQLATTRQSALLALLAGGTLLAMPVNSASAQQVAPPTMNAPTATAARQAVPGQEALYYSGDRPVRAWLATDEVAVLVDGNGRQQLAATLQSLPGVRSVADDDEFPNYLFLRVDAGNKTLLAETMDSVARAGGALETYAVLYGDSASSRAPQEKILLPNSISVQLADPAALNDLAARHGLEVVEQLDFLENTWVLRARKGGALAALQTSATLKETEAEVVYATPNVKHHRVKRQLPVDDPLYPRQWHLRNTGQTPNGLPGLDINIEPAWTTARGAAVNIAIIDDGVQVTHPDLAANARTDIDIDLRGSGATPVEDSDPSPAFVRDTHGTAVAGIVGAVADNDEGGAGVAPQAGLVGVRIGFDQFLDDVMEARALAHRITDSNPDNRVHVSNNSWGPTDNARVLAGPGPNLAQVLNTGVSSGRAGSGTIFVWSAGNGNCVTDNVNFDGYANSPYTIAVGAVGADGEPAFYSEFGSSLVVSAPSSYGLPGLCTTDVAGTITTDITDPGAVSGATGFAGYAAGDYTASFGGTSSAAPTVSGVVALMLEANPGLGWRDVQHILIDSATRDSLPDTGWQANGSGREFSHRYGFGLVNAGAALLSALVWDNVGERQTLVIPSTVPRAIPDNDTTGISQSVTVDAPGAFFTEHVEVEVNISHLQRGDLRLELTSPSGMTSILATPRLEDEADNFESWTFTSVAHWGESPDGQWTLRVADEQALNDGTIQNWTLRLNGFDAVGRGNQPIVLPNPTPVPPDQSRNFVTNAGFEEGTASWEVITSGSNIICTGDDCSASSLFFPYSGTAYATFGSQGGNAQFQSLRQDIFIPADTSTLSMMYMVVPFQGTNPANNLAVFIDGIQVAQLTNVQSTLSSSTSAYYEVLELDVAGFADSDVHELEFVANQSAGGSGTVFLVDDVKLLGPEDVVVTPTPTPDPDATPTPTPIPPALAFNETELLYKAQWEDVQGDLEVLPGGVLMNAFSSNDFINGAETDFDILYSASFDGGTTWSNPFDLTSPAWLLNFIEIEQFTIEDIGSFFISYGDENFSPQDGEDDSHQDRNPDLEVSQNPQLPTGIAVFEEDSDGDLDIQLYRTNDPLGENFRNVMMNKPIDLEGDLEAIADNARFTKLNWRYSGGDGAIDRNPRIITNSNGFWVTIWESNQSTLPYWRVTRDDTGEINGEEQYFTAGIGNDFDIFYSVSFSDGLYRRTVEVEDGGTLNFKHDAGWSDPLFIPGLGNDTGDDINPDMTLGFDDDEEEWVAVWSSNDDFAGLNNRDRDIVVVQGRFTITPEDVESFDDDDWAQAVRNGDFVISWSSPALLDVNAPSDTNLDDHPKIAYGDGGFICVWLSTTREGLQERNLLYSRAFKREDNGVLIWSQPRRINTLGAGDRVLDVPPQIATDGEGNWVVQYTRSSADGQSEELMTSYSRDNGGTWSTPALIPQLEDESRSASDLVHYFDDTFMSVYATNASVGVVRTEPKDLFVSVTEDGGENWTERLNIKADSDEDFDGALDVVSDQNGTIVTAWSSTEEYYAVRDSADDEFTRAAFIRDDSKIYFSRSFDDGRLFTQPEPLPGIVNVVREGEDQPALIGEDFAPSIATDGNGGWMIAWFNFFEDLENPDDRSREGDIYIIRSGDGGQLWEGGEDGIPIAVNEGATFPEEIGDDRFPDVASDGNNRWLIAWQSTTLLPGETQTGSEPDSDILVAYSDDLGDTWTQSYINSTALSDSGDDVSPELVYTGGGVWICAWTSEDDTIINGQRTGIDADVFYAVSQDNGETWGPVQVLNSTAFEDEGFDGEVSMGFNGGRVVAAWTTTEESLGGGGVNPLSESDVAFAITDNQGNAWSEAESLQPFGDTDYDANVQVNVDPRAQWIISFTSTADDGASSAASYVLSSNGQSWGTASTYPLPPTDLPQLEDEPTLNNGVRSAAGIDGRWIGFFATTRRLESNLFGDFDIVRTRTSEKSSVTVSPTGVDLEVLIGTVPENLEFDIINQGPGDTVIFDTTEGSAFVASLTPESGSFVTDPAQPETDRQTVTLDWAESAFDPSQVSDGEVETIQLIFSFTNSYTSQIVIPVELSFVDELTTTPTPTATPTVSPTASPSPTVSPTATASPSPSPSPSPTATAVPTTTPTATPTATPQPTRTDTPTPTATATTTPNPTPTPDFQREEFTFSSDTQGWEFRNIDGFESAQGAFDGERGAINILVQANQNSFAFWQSPFIRVVGGQADDTGPTTIQGATGPEQLYRATWDVSTNLLERERIPTLRFRASSFEFERTAELTVTSTGSTEFTPTPSGKRYFQYFTLPAAQDRFRLYFDLLNFEGQDLAEGRFSLRTLELEFLGNTSELAGQRAMGAYNLRDDAVVESLGFRSVSADTGTLQPPAVFSTDNGLRIQGIVPAVPPLITPAPERSIFGFWGSGSLQPEGLGAPGLLEVRWTVTSSLGSGAALANPAFRLRVNDSSNQMAALVQFESQGAGALLPDNSGAQTYSSWVWWPQEFVDNGWRLSFDYLWIVGSDNDPAAAVTLQELQLFRYEAP